MGNLKFSQKKSFKIGSQNFKNPNGRFMCTVGDKIQDKFETFGLCFVGVAF